MKNARQVLPRDRLWTRRCFVSCAAVIVCLTILITVYFVWPLVVLDHFLRYETHLDGSALAHAAEDDWLIPLDYRGVNGQFLPTYVSSSGRLLPICLVSSEIYAIVDTDEERIIASFRPLSVSTEEGEAWLGLQRSFVPAINDIRPIESADDLSFGLEINAGVILPRWWPFRRSWENDPYTYSAGVGRYYAKRLIQYDPNERRWSAFNQLQQHRSENWPPLAGAINVERVSIPNSTDDLLLECEVREIVMGQLHPTIRTDYRFRRLSRADRFSRRTQWEVDGETFDAITERWPPCVLQLPRMDFASSMESADWCLISQPERSTTKGLERPGHRWRLDLDSGQVSLVVPPPEVPAECSIASDGQTLLWFDNRSSTLTGWHISNGIRKLFGPCRQAGKFKALTRGRVLFPTFNDDGELKIDVVPIVGGTPHQVFP